MSTQFCTLDMTSLIRVLCDCTR